MSTISAQISASLNGDREAFGEIIQKYQNTVCAVTYSITGNLHLSEDLAQEAFVTAWMQLRELQDEAKFPAWLCGIARNLAHNWMRKNARRKTAIPHSELVEQLAVSDESIPDELDREAKSAMVWEILRELPENYREPLVLYYQQSQAVGDIAAALDLSEETVRQRLSRGRARIRTEVAERVERALNALQPDKMFYVTVLAALPVAAMSTAQAVAATFAAATGGTMAGGASGGGTVGGTAGATTIWGVILNVVIMAFWILFFPCLFVVAVIGNYAQLRDQPTLRSRRAHLKYHMMIIGMIYAFISLSMIVAVAVPMKFFAGSVAVGWSTVFVCLPMAALILGIFYRFKVRTVLEEDLGKRAAPDVPLEESPFSLRAVKRVVFFTTVTVSIIIIVCLGTTGGALVYYSFSASPLAGIAAGISTVCVIACLIYLVARFMQLMLAMATEEGMIRYPPKESYTVLKYRPQRWWKNNELEKPLKMRDYFVQMIPGAMFTMLLLTGCRGTIVSTEAFLLAVLPMLSVGPIALWGIRKRKNARIKAGNIAGIFSILWMLFAVAWLLYAPLAERWSVGTVRNYIAILVMIFVSALIQIAVSYRRDKGNRT